jgi:hypothetical protein
MKFFWFSEEVEEIRQAAFKEGQNTGYQQGYQMMLAKANQVLGSYYKLVATLVKVQNLDFGPIPALEDPNLEDYLNRVLYKVNEPYSLYQPAKKENVWLKEVIAAQEQKIKSLENRSLKTENQFSQEKDELTAVVDLEKERFEYQKKLLIERNQQLEKIIAELQNRLDWQGNKSGQQTG